MTNLYKKNILKYDIIALFIKIQNSKYAVQIKINIE